MYTSRMRVGQQVEHRAYLAIWVINSVQDKSLSFLLKIILNMWSAL